MLHGYTAFTQTQKKDMKVKEPSGGSNRAGRAGSTTTNCVYANASGSMPHTIPTSNPPRAARLSTPGQRWCSQSVRVGGVRVRVGMEYTVHVCVC